MLLSPFWTELFDRALAAQSRAYAPYSLYHVGCALKATSGEIYTGCNVENATYGATVCAERSAVSAMITAGDREIQQLLVVTDDLGTPCGICRQVIAEFAAQDLQIACCNREGTHVVYALDELLPHRFRLQSK